MAVVVAVVGATAVTSRISKKALDKGEGLGASQPLALISVEFSKETIAGRDVAVWKPSGVGRHPLIVFSHGFGGSNVQSKFLMKGLAEHGYLVVAPNHHDANSLAMGGLGLLAEFRHASRWTDATYRDRRDDIVAILKAMKLDPKWTRSIDWDRMGLVGHSLGGYTALGLAGAWPSWKLSGVKAVLALSPDSAPFILRDSLKGLSVPVMYQGGTLDYGITPSIRKNSGAYDQTPSPAYYVEFFQGGHLAWTDLNPRFQSTIVLYSVALFDRYLLNKPSAVLDQKQYDVTVLRHK